MRLRDRRDSLQHPQIVPPPPAATHAAQAGLQYAPDRAAERSRAALVTLLEPLAWSRVQLIIDAVVLYLATSAALFASPSPNATANRWLAFCFPLIALAVMRLRPYPDQRLLGSIVDTVGYVLAAVSLTTLLALSLESLASASHPVELALRFWLFALVYVAGARITLLSVRRQGIRSPTLTTPALIVGAGMVGEHLVKRLSRESGYGLRPVGFVDSDPLPRAAGTRGCSIPVLGGLDDLPDAIASAGARHVIFAFSSEPDHRLVDRIRDCERLGVTVSLVPRLYESISDRATFDHIGGIPLVTLRTVDPKGWQFAIKHGFDRAFALVALVAAAPLMLAAALAVRLSSPGPVLFRQRRVGRDGREFDVLKFRTMREDRGGSEFELPEGSAPGGVEGQDRRTPLGRYLRDLSLDELPQLINVLRGDMSIVGPRPERPEYVDRFAAEVDRYQDRHRVKSGITGWAQVNGLRGQTSIADRVEWDNYYIQNWSLRFDLRIMALTIAEILRFRG
jgi:exopolysaccharide biosynthesis polyprenyl glycosylphosphotransferase